MGTCDVTIFGPHPLLTVTIERRGDADDVHLHAGGQGLWVARMAAELGARPLLCAFTGGETGAVLRMLMERLEGERRLVETSGGSGCVVIDRRNGERNILTIVGAPAPSRHECDELTSAACARALDSGAFVLCNAYPGDAVPLEAYEMLVSDVRAAGVPVLVDLSAGRLEHALAGGPDVVKLNDWELAEYVSDSVEGLVRRRRAAELLLARGAGTVIVTRGPEPALVLRGDEAWELIPPRFERGACEGCGDSMMGALAAATARGFEWDAMLRLGAAAGAANFLRHGLGTGTRDVVERLVSKVELRPL